jgi:hypothetical protein
MLKDIGFNDMRLPYIEDRKIGCIAALSPIFAGFFLGFVFCLVICLCSGCSSKKNVTTSVVVDSTAMSATTEIGVLNTEATAFKNLSLHFDTLEMWLSPDISHSWPISPTPDPDGNATAETAVARPSTSMGVPGASSGMPFNLAELISSMGGGAPIYIRGVGAGLDASSNTSAKESETKIHADTTSNKVGKQEDSHEDVDRTAVSKPPDMTWVIIAGFAILAILIYFKK